MFIQTEQTPNPASLKFLPGCEVAPRAMVEFKNAAEAEASPLAARLFKIANVKSIFLGKDFITVTKADNTDWNSLRVSLLGAIMEHFTTGGKVMTDEDLPQKETGLSEISEDDGEIVRQIKEILNDRVSPAVAQDGGEIVFSSFEDGIVYLHMRGACAGCPGASATLKNGVERLLKQFIPEVREVRPIKDMK